MMQRKFLDALYRNYYDEQQRDKIIDKLIADAKANNDSKLEHLRGQAVQITLSKAFSSNMIDLYIETHGSEGQ